MNLGVCVWLYNEENLIVDCVESIRKVFPQVEVYDIGSKDKSIEKVQSLEVPINLLGTKGKPGGREYIRIKREINANYDYVFNVDGDEIYPESALMFLRDLIESRPSRIHGFWRAVKFNGEDLFVSSLYNSGEIAWDPKQFEIRRNWPSEALLYVGENAKPPKRIFFGEVFCWHGVLLNRTSVVEDKSRVIKKSKRDEQFRSLGWERVKSLPWNTDDKDLINKLKHNVVS